MRFTEWMPGLTKDTRRARNRHDLMPSFSLMDWIVYVPVCIGD
jgi:hypothetical protein